MPKFLVTKNTKLTSKYLVDAKNEADARTMDEYTAEERITSDQFVMTVEPFVPQTIVPATAAQTNILTVK